MAIGKFIRELPEGTGNLASSNIEIEIQRKDAPDFTEKKTLSDMLIHGNLPGRDADDSHPSSAITGLDAKQISQDAATAQAQSDIDSHVILPDAHHPQLHDLDSHTDVDLVTDTPVNNDRLAFNSNTGLWIPKESVSALGIVEFEYRWSTPVDVTPTDGKISTNNADPTLVTMLYVHEESQGNRDRSLFYDNLDLGDWMNIHDDNDAEVFMAYDVAAPPTKVGNMYNVPVVYFNHATPDFNPNEKIALFVRYAGVSGAANEYYEQPTEPLTARVGAIWKQT